MRNKFYKNLFENNSKWIAQKKAQDELYFEKLSQGQSPKYLMIGCSDSRVPISTMFNAEPGEIFIHRNIANQVGITDMNLLSVLEYSVEHLHIEHIVVIGHYRCGGVAAAVDGVNQGLIENWVAPIKELYIKHKHKIDTIDNKQHALDKLSEINVVAQVKNILKTSIMQRAFKRDKYPQVHALIFDIYSGEINELKLPFEEWISAGLLPKADYSTKK